MRVFHYPVEMDGEFVFEEITEDEILMKYRNMHDRMMVTMGRPEDATDEKCIEFFMETFLAEEV